MVELLLTALERYGLAVAFLIAVSYAAWKMLAAKDIIIANKDLAMEEQDKEHKTELLEKSRAYAAGMAEKDKEIKRLHEARFTDSTAHGERMLGATKGATEQVHENTQSMGVVGAKLGDVATRLGELTQEVRGLPR